MIQEENLAVCSSWSNNKELFQLCLKEAVANYENSAALAFAGPRSLSIASVNTFNNNRPSMWLLCSTPGVVVLPIGVSLLYSNNTNKIELAALV
jgi:hypothetical protein